MLAKSEGHDRALEKTGEEEYVVFGKISKTYRKAFKLTTTFFFSQVTHLSPPGLPST